MKRQYICIDLKSFYASVECVERGLDPMITNLVVADADRSKNTICLAITPAMKKLGIKNRCRLGEIPKNIDYLIAVPRMSRYITYSADIYSIYLSFFSKDDIHVYSIDEAFIDVTDYLKLYKMTAKELGKTVMNEIYGKLGIRATCGVGTNLYLTKVALDMLAKHSPDFICELTEETFRNTLWNHRPLTDFWRIGVGTAKRLEQNGIFTMHDIAFANEDTLYKIFGIDAELIIDHAYGKETATIKDIKAYKPQSNSLSSTQILMRNYTADEAETVIKEMADNLCLEMTAKEVVTSSITVFIGYSHDFSDGGSKGTVKMPMPTNNSNKIMKSVEKLYKNIVTDNVPIRRLGVFCNNIQKETEKQFSLFETQSNFERNYSIQKTINEIRYRYGKNSIIRGMDLKNEATTMLRNSQIGGHRSG